MTTQGSIKYVRRTLEFIGYPSNQFSPNVLYLNSDLFAEYEEDFQYWKIVLEKNGFRCVHVVHTDVDAITTLTRIWEDNWGSHPTEEEERAEFYMDEPLN